MERLKQLIAFYRSTTWASIQSFFGVKGKLHIKWDSEFLRKNIKDGIEPFLRGQGWDGNGLTFSKVNQNGIINHLEFIQEAHHLGIGLSIELPFLRNLNVPSLDLSQNRDIVKSVPQIPGLRKELKLPENDKELKKWFKSIRTVYNLECKSFFSEFDDWKSFFLKITPNSIENGDSGINSTTETRQALLCAKIFVHLKEYEKAEEMVIYGLSTIKGPTGNGSALIPVFESLQNLIEQLKRK